jgi:phage gpG-like protein
MVQFHLLGVSEFKAAIDGHIARQLAATRVAVGKGAHLIEEKAKLELSTSSHPRGTPTPSRPGEPPSLVSGTLRRSVRVQGPTNIDATSYTASVGPTAIYGRIQELGGEAGRWSYLPPRPYMAPGITKAGPELQAIFRDAWAKW